MAATAGPVPPWPMPPALKASIGLHVAAAGLAIAAPPDAWWALGAVVANHAVLTTAGLWPRSSLLGPNLTRLPAAAAMRGEIALTLDDGPDPEVTPRVLEQLDRAGAKVSFFCIAERARAQPALTRELIARGHSVENHSQLHRHNFALLGPRGMAAEIERAQETLADITGIRPTCFRAPAGLRNPFLDPVLHRLGLRLVSWTRRGFDTRERDPQRVLMRLCKGLARGDILLMHDGHAAHSAHGRAVVLDTLPLLLDRLRGDGLRTVSLPAALHGAPA